jgi:hypothetical protein
MRERFSTRVPEMPVHHWRQGDHCEWPAFGVLGLLVTAPGGNMANQTGRLYLTSIPCREPQCCDKMPCSGLCKYHPLQPGQFLGPVGWWMLSTTDGEQPCEACLLRQSNWATAEDSISATAPTKPSIGGRPLPGGRRMLAVGNRYFGFGDAALNQKRNQCRAFLLVWAVSHQRPYSSHDGRLSSGPDRPLSSISSRR